MRIAHSSRPSLLVDPIPHLVRSLAISSSIGMVFNTMYNVVDTYFGQFLSTDGLAALSLSFPFFFVIIAAGSGIATGATALISNSLGAGNEERAVHLQTQAISFGVLAAIILTAVGLAVAPAAYRFMGATEPVLVLALQYIRVILLGTVFFSAQPDHQCRSHLPRGGAEPPQRPLHLDDPQYRSRSALVGKVIRKRNCEKEIEGKNSRKRSTDRGSQAHSRVEGRYLSG